MDRNCFYINLDQDKCALMDDIRKGLVQCGSNPNNQRPYIQHRVLAIRKSNVVPSPAVSASDK